MTRPRLDEATRPKAPPHPDAPVTALGRHGQELLIGVHAHLRHEMAEVVRAVDAVAAGALAPEAAGERIEATAMLRNYRWFASFCGRHCQVVQVHHTIEDRRMFVDIGEADPSLGPVLDRLREEHEVIHGMLTTLVALLGELVSEGARLPEVVAEVRALHEALISHLDYEEGELLGAIGRLSIPV